MMDPEVILDRRRLRRRASLWRFAAILSLVVAVLALVWASGGLGTSGGATGAQVARIEIDGFIGTRPDEVKVLERAAKSPLVRAIVLRIDSPGGAAAGGEALYRAIREAAAEKPIVAIIDGLGTSAAYMAAIAADRVVARESAITGSIGVIFQSAHVENLLSRLGVGTIEIKSRPLKAEPSPFSAPTPEAIQMVQGVVDDTYRWFVGLVRERRGLQEAEALQVADGRIFTGRQALALRLVDELGDEDTARAWLETEKGVSDDLPAADWEEREGFGLFSASSLAALAGRTFGFDAVLGEGASFIASRLPADGLLAVWRAPRLGEGSAAP